MLLHSTWMHTISSNKKTKSLKKVSHLYQDKKDHKKLNPNKWSVIQVVLTFYDVIIVGNIVAREKAK